MEEMGGVRTSTVAIPPVLHVLPARVGWVKHLGTFEAVGQKGRPRLGRAEDEGIGPETVGELIGDGPERGSLHGCHKLKRERHPRGGKDVPAHSCERECKVGSELAIALPLAPI